MLGGQHFSWPLKTCRKHSRPPRMHDNFSCPPIAFEVEYPNSFHYHSCQPSTYLWPSKFSKIFHAPSYFNPPPPPGIIVDNSLTLVSIYDETPFNTTLGTCSLSLSPVLYCTTRMTIMQLCTSSATICCCTRVCLYRYTACI